MQSRRATALAAATAILVLAGAARGQSAVPVYPTPQDALEALVAAMETGNADVAIATIDPTAGDLIHSDDPDEVAATLKNMVDLYRAGFRFVPGEDGEVVIDLGDDDWPFPVPLMKSGSGWSFDAEAGRQEITDREIGRNELDVIDALHVYVDIQATYRTIDHDGDGVPEFAARIISSEGMHDGLYWPDGDDSPIGDIAARASLDGFQESGEDSTAEPFHGYYYRILTAQGPSAPGGAMSYVINGHMVAGHALLAVPAEYGVTGIHSFIVSEAGTLYQADLGEKTLETAFGLTAFEPDARWEPVQDE